MGRIRFYWGYLGAVRKVLVAVCIVMANLSWLPDRWRGHLSFLIPNWRWQTWLLIAAVLLCAFILEEAHYRDLAATAEGQSSKKPEQTFLVPILAVALIAVCWVGSVFVQHRSARHPIITAAVQPPQTPVETVPPPAPTPKLPKKKRHEKPKNPNLTQANSGANNTNTQVGTAQGPLAIAPNGIANAAPNLGSQTVNNFAPLQPNIVATPSPSELQPQGTYKTKFAIKTDRTADHLSFALIFDGPFVNASVSTTYTQMVATATNRVEWQGHPGFMFSLTYPTSLPPEGEIDVTVDSAQPLKLLRFAPGP